MTCKEPLLHKVNLSGGNIRGGPLSVSNSAFLYHFILLYRLPSEKIINVCHKCSACLFKYLKPTVGLHLAAILLVKNL